MTRALAAVRAWWRRHGAEARREAEVIEWLAALRAGADPGADPVLSVSHGEESFW